MPVILENVSYIYDRGTAFENKALDNVSLHIEDGSFVGICGKTGSGKSTLARIMAGLIKPTEGTVSASDVGLVFQFPEYQLFEETVIKDVMFGPLNMGLSQKEAEIRAREALALVNLDESFEDRNPLLLSGGEKRRVAIAGVLAIDRDVLILDEPAAGLDLETHDKVFECLSSLNSRGKTIIVISHEAIADKVITLSEGKVVQKL